MVELGQECIVAGELLFNPSLFLSNPSIAELHLANQEKGNTGREGCLIPEYIHKSIMKCDVCIRDDLFPNIVLTGTRLPIQCTQISK